MADDTSDDARPAPSEPDEANPDPLTGAPGAHPVGVGVGAAGGAAAGAVLGAAAGPVGAAVGSVVGAVAGGLAGKGAAEAVNPTDPTATPEPSATGAAIAAVGEPMATTLLPGDKHER